MTTYTFKFHFEKKPDEMITWSESSNISDPFKEYSRKIKENKEDLIFYYKGSSFKYNECEKNSFKNEMFSKISPNAPININAFPLRKTKKHKLTLKLSSSKDRQEALAPDLVPMNKIKKEKQLDNNSIILSENKKKEEKVDEIEYYNDILCPSCLTTSIIENDGYKLSIINCNNFHHIPNITFDRFESNDSFPMAKCGMCSSYKYQFNTPPTQYYYCSCGYYICPSCYTTHDRGHKKIEIEKKNYHCMIHDRDFNSYCLDCNSNICENCTEQHPQHEILKYVHLTPKREYIESITKEVEMQKKDLNKFIEFTRKTFDDVLKEIHDYLNKYIIIEKTLLKRYNNKPWNFQLLQNIRNNKLFLNNSIFKELTLTDEDKSNNANSLKKIYGIFEEINKAKTSAIIKEEKPLNFVELKKPNVMELTYKIKEKGINKVVKLFDSIFVENNRNKLELKINGKKEKELIEYYNNASDLGELKVEIKEKIPVTDMSYMFNNCKKLASVNTQNWDTTNVVNMESLFQLCSFDQIPDISNWKTANLTNMRAMFSKCINLKTIPEMSKWITTNVKDMSLLFNGCISIESIDVSH